MDDNIYEYQTVWPVMITFPSFLFFSNKDVLLTHVMYCISSTTRYIHISVIYYPVNINIIFWKCYFGDIYKYVCVYLPQHKFLSDLYVPCSMLTNTLSKRYRHMPLVFYLVLSYVLNIKIYMTPLFLDIHLLDSFHTTHKLSWLNMIHFPVEY